LGCSSALRVLSSFPGSPGNGAAPNSAARPLLQQPCLACHSRGCSPDRVLRTPCPAPVPSNPARYLAIAFERQLTTHPLNAPNYGRRSPSSAHYPLWLSTGRREMNIIAQRRRLIARLVVSPQVARQTSTTAADVGGEGRHEQTPSADPRKPTREQLDRPPRAPDLVAAPAQPTLPPPLAVDLQPALVPARERIQRHAGGGYSSVRC